MVRNKQYIVEVLQNGECETKGEIIHCFDCRFYDREKTYCGFWMRYLTDMWRATKEYCSKGKERLESLS